MRVYVAVTIPAAVATILFPATIEALPAATVQTPPVRVVTRTSVVSFIQIVPIVEVITGLGNTVMGCEV